VALVGGLIAISVSSRGLTGTVSHAVDSFTTTRESDLKPSRLLSVASQNRVVWWKEAVGAFSDRPLAGWGAGSFPVVHLLYRRNSLMVQQPHSVPLQWLAETGIIGALLATGAYGLLTAAAVGSVRRKEGSERLIAASLLAMIVIYGVHALFDWDWDIPGVTLPMLIAVGVLVGADRLGTARSARSRAAPAPRPTRPPAAGPAARTVTLLAVAGALCAIALSGVVPSLAAGRASAALVAATSSSGSGLNQARSDAAEAARLDPFSDAGLVASATIALHSGQNRRARSYLLQAVRRDPQDVRAWQGLTVVDFGLGLTGATFNAIRHVVALDPKGPGVKLLTKQVELLLTPPSGSATARPSPAAAR
jgi:O-antigen ligase